MAVSRSIAPISNLSRDEIISRLRDGILAARSDVLAIIVFGSFARGAAWRDVDVLVVLEKLETTHQARTNAALALHEASAIPEVQIVLYSLAGFERGLRNHTPFLLDIATDGLVVEDRANVTASLALARQYIREKGIRRTRPGGWRFPVKYRQRTYLSERSNEDFVRLWLGDPARDLEAATALRATGLHDRAVYYCQQAAERAVKAVLGCFGGFERTHYVADDLRKQLKQEDPSIHRDRLLALVDIAAGLEEHVTRSRYIIVDDENEEQVWNPSEHYFDADSSAALCKASEAVDIAREFVAWWFAPGATADAAPPPEP